MNAIRRVVVDECLGQASALLDPLRGLLGNGPIEFLFLAAEHTGIPDIEILERFLDARSALLTKDRVLHNLAIGRGFRSFVHTPESGLTDGRLPHVSAPDKHLPVRVGRSAPRDGHQAQSVIEARAITECLGGLLSEHQLKQFRTKRRRIRAHFGSSDNIASVTLTIAQRHTARGMIGGYMLKVDAHHGIKSLFPASEGYSYEENPRLCRGGWLSLTFPAVCPAPFRPHDPRRLIGSAESLLSNRLRIGPFEGPATAKPPALPEDIYFVAVVSSARCSTSDRRGSAPPARRKATCCAWMAVKAIV